MTEALRLATAAVIAIVATGAAPPDEPSPALKPLLECRATADPAARLACFDRAVDGLTAATRSGDVVVTDRATVREAKRARFGLGWLPHREPAAGAAARDEDDDTPTEITSTVAGAVDHGYGTWDYSLANGMRWRQVEPSDILPKAGQAVTIRKAAFGSYFLKIGKERAVRVVRLR